MTPNSLTGPFGKWQVSRNVRRWLWKLKATGRLAKQMPAVWVKPFYTVETPTGCWKYDKGTFHPLVVSDAPWHMCVCRIRSQQRSSSNSSALSTHTSNIHTPPTCTHTLTHSFTTLPDYTNPGWFMVAWHADMPSIQRGCVVFLYDWLVRSFIPDYIQYIIIFNKLLSHLLQRYLCWCTVRKMFFLRCVLQRRETGVGHGLEWKGENRITADIKQQRCYGGRRVLLRQPP